MRPDCRVMAERLRTAARDAGITTVILANLWQRPELTPELLVEIEVWWSEGFDRVILASPLPRFTHIEERLLRWPRDRVAALTPDLSLAEGFARARARVAGSELVVLDAEQLFCGDRPGCSVLGEGPLQRDGWSHLTVEGATGYAERLRATGFLASLDP
jgi:SGNH domain (fused to AT3 domains)